MTKRNLSERARSLLEDRWRLTPARMAEYLTNGRFKRFAHLRFLERRIAAAVGRGGARLLITMPPRHGKSWLASVYTPAWFLSLWPRRNVIVASYDQSVAESWRRAVRDLLARNEAALAVRVEAGQCAAVGVGGAVNGAGGHLLIVDDPVKSWKAACSESARRSQVDWFNSTFRARAEKGASIIVTMTRWHQHDLAGYLEHEDKESWEVIRVPAIAESGDALGRVPGAALCPERFDLEALERLRDVIGSRAWQARYQQAPEPVGGQILRRDWWRVYETLPTVFDEVVQSWDLAFKGGTTSDYVVGQVWGRVGGDRYLIDQVRGRMDFPATVEAVKGLARRHASPSRILVEAKANGCALVASLKESVPGLVLVEPDGGKLARISGVSARIEAGKVHLPHARGAPWIESFLEECADFPNGRHDDQVDAMAYALASMENETLNNHEGGLS